MDDETERVPYEMGVVTYDDQTMVQYVFDRREYLFSVDQFKQLASDTANISIDAVKVQKERGR